MMSYSIAGGVSMGAAQLHESQLDRLMRYLRKSSRSIIDALTSPGKP